MAIMALLYTLAATAGLRQAPSWRHTAGAARRGRCAEPGPTIEARHWLLVCESCFAAPLRPPRACTEFE